MLCLLIHLNESSWTNDVICIPTLHGMDDVIFLVFAMYKQLVDPHLVGWISQIWYIPTWLGDGCMYESLVIGRSFVMYV